MFSLCLALLFVNSACVCHKLVGKKIIIKECNKKSTSKKKRKYKQ